MDEVLRGYLDTVVAVLQEVVADQLIAIWAVGSLATGDFDLRCSDIDVIGVASGPLGGAERDSLAIRLSHSQLQCPAYGLDFILYGAPELSGPSRTPRYELSLATGRDWQDDFGTGGPYAGGLPDLELARRRGLTLAGATPNQIIAPVPRGWLREEVTKGIRWHKERVHDPFHDPEGANAVLNACRALHLVATGEFVSKTEGARWFSERGHQEIVAAALGARCDRRGQPLDYEKVVSFLDKVLLDLA